MEVTPTPETSTPTPDLPNTKPRIADYWPAYHHQAMALTILVQLGLAGLLAAGLFLNGVSVVATLAIFILVAIAATICNLLLIVHLLQPLENLTSAITHISGEPNHVRPPSPNARSFQKNGFSRLLQTIYELSLQPASAEDTAHTASQTLLGTAIGQSNDSLVILDETGAILYASPNAPVKLSQNGSQELELIFEDDVDLTMWLQDCRERLVRANTSWLRVANRLVGEDKRRIFDITANYEKASTTPVVLSIHDRTELYAPEDDQLDFIAFAAHELRGPVTVVRGYADVLAQEIPDTPENAEQHILIQRLAVSASRLSGYISNILNASKYDRRHMQLHLSEQQLVDIYASVADDAQNRASTQGRLLSVAIPTDLPAVAADSTSLGEVFINLIDNAIKYSNEGGTVTVQARSDSSNVYVDVIDQGIGMPGNVMSNLFHKFYRSHRSRETVAGTGIGLYICKAIIESHGGGIEAKSEVGHGSTFSFRLPTYESVAEKLASSDNSNQDIIRSSHGWIKNHSKYRG